MADMFTFGDRVFLHGLSLDNWHACHNLTMGDCLWSSDYIAYSENWSEEEHVSIRNLTIEDLREGNLKGTLTPRASTMGWGASFIRRGGKMGYGETNTRWLPDNVQQNILIISNAELDFEEGRRLYSPKAPSRLSCLYVADNTQAGKAHILSMLKSPYIVEVLIPQFLEIAVADSTWFDKYCESPDPIFIQKYWQNVPYEEGRETWEYLVNGVIKIKNQEDLFHIREFGRKLWKDKS